ncbi:MAG: SUMF1/EgtB/PvdO family nonheme iron enzyme [Bacteroidales bacterium]|nr:SUMF1/EgtB/PvdO family nonheme iron enzyme [Bacteroidales bacterium]
MKYLYQILLMSLLNVSVLTSAQDYKALRIQGTPKLLDTEKLVLRHDANGNYCAAVQIISDMDGFQYDSNDGMVGKIERKPGMDLIYLTASERVLEIYKKGYNPMSLVFSEYGIKLEPQRIWQIYLTGEKEGNEVLVSIEVTPPDAGIFVDNLPFENSGYLSPGKHLLTIEKEGYKPINREIEVDFNNIYFTEILEKIPDAVLQIESAPSDAIVLLNDSILGKTPLSVFYPVGSYQLKIYKEGYDTLTREPFIINDPLTRISFNIEEVVSYITIKTIQNAKVFINDDLILNIEKIKVKPGNHLIRVEFVNHEPQVQTVNIKRDQHVTVEFYPDILYGSFRISAVPFDARIRLFSDSCKIYEASGARIFEKLVSGIYKIEIAAKGFKTHTENIHIKPDEEIVRMVRLEESVSMNDEIPQIDDFILVKGGCFLMGNESGPEDEKPVHEECIDDFYMCRYEVTQKLWEYIMGNNPSFGKQSDYLPVNNITFFEIKEFIRRLNRITSLSFRLPTEAEWEFAARAGNSGNSFLFSGSNSIDSVAWHSGNADNRSHMVGLKSPNALGLFDMSGNILEVCQDWYKEKTNPINSKFKMAKGGSWFYTEYFCRNSSRFRTDPLAKDFNVGFRLVRDP